MPTDRKLMQQILDAWDRPHGINWHDFAPYMNALRARLAQTEQDGECSYCDGAGCIACDARFLSAEAKSRPMAYGVDGATVYIKPPIYNEKYLTGHSAPPQREWQGLTDEEVKAVWSELWYDLGNGKFAASDATSRHTAVMFANAIESKLKEKNHD